MGGKSEEAHRPSRRVQKVTGAQSPSSEDRSPPIRELLRGKKDVQNSERKQPRFAQKERNKEQAQVMSDVLQ